MEDDSDCPEIILVTPLPPGRSLPERLDERVGERPLVFPERKTLFRRSRRKTGKIFPFFSLPVELRNRVYSFALISPLSTAAQISMHRPICVDDKVRRIGYFKQDAGISLLLANYQIYIEAVEVLYMENIFIFHISGLTDGPIEFLNQIPSKFLRFLRQVYIRTGYCVNRLLGGYRSWQVQQRYPSKEIPDKERAALIQEDIDGSANLVRQALPSRCSFSVNCEETIPMFIENDLQKVSDALQADYRGNMVLRHWYLWKMVIVENPSTGRRKEFRRIEWWGG